LAGTAKTSHRGLSRANIFACIEKFSLESSLGDGYGSAVCRRLSVRFYNGALCNGEKIVLFVETVGSCCFVAGYWAATRTSIGSGSSVIAGVGLAKV
jgi:hypothetical protein